MPIRIKSSHLWLIFAVAAVLPYLPAFLHPLHELSVDWNYFNSLSLIVRSSLLEYGVFPMHDPWVNGGFDLLANPQSRIVSPALLLDLLFVPQWANLISLMIYGFFGLWGMFRFLRLLGTSKRNSVVGSIFFIYGSWFGLHFSEGHIPYGSLQLLPWVGYFGLRLARPRSWVALSLLLSFFLLDGGIYTFIFSGFLLLSLLASGVRPPQKFFGGRKAVWPALGSTALLVCLSSPKWIPVLSLQANRRPNLDFLSVPLEWVPTILFYPFQTNILPIDFSNYLRFHEFGTYIGFIATGLVLTAITLRRLPKRHLKFIPLILFWAWVAFGWGGDWNPWHLFHKIPLANNAHIQSRVLLLSFFLFTALLAMSLDRLRFLQRSEKRKNLLAWGVLSTLLISEAYFVRTYSLFNMYERFSTPHATEPLIQNKGVQFTTRNGSKPGLYFSGSAAVVTYEPAARATDVLDRESTEYRGEIYPLQGTGEVELLSHTPGRIRFTHANATAMRVEINTNWLAGWTSDENKVRVHKTPRGLVGVEVPAGTGEIRLQYSPSYLPWIWTLFSLGLIFTAFALWRVGARRHPKAARPEAQKAQH